MSSTNDSSIIELLTFNTDPQLIGVSVVYANPTATAFAFGCMPGQDDSDCGVSGEQVTVGPWAQATPPPSASTGSYDVSIEDPDDTFKFSLHCDMTSKTPATCTVVASYASDSAATSLVITSPAADDAALAWTYMPVTITAGQQQLGKASIGAGAAVSTSRTADTTSPGQTVIIQNRASQTISKISNTALSTVSSAATGVSSKPASTTSSAINSAVSSTTTANSASAGLSSHGMGSIAMAAVVLSWFVR